MKYLICQGKLFFKKINPQNEDFYKIFFNSETSFVISKLFFSISEIISVFPVNLLTKFRFSSIFSKLKLEINIHKIKAKVQKIWIFRNFLFFK